MMYKILIIVTLLLSGCSNFKITGTMCDEINREPGSVIPEECRAYDEKKADEAFNKKRNEQIHSAEDIIKFSKETDDK
jgi:hypothetical protein